DRARDPEDSAGELLPVAPGPAPAGRAGAARRRAGGVRPRRLNAEGGRRAEGARPRRDAEVRDLAELYRARRRGRGISEPAITVEHPYLWIDATYHKVRRDDVLTQPREARPAGRAARDLGRARGTQEGARHRARPGRAGNAAACIMPTSGLCRVEPPRLCRRLHDLRGWSHETTERVLTGGAGAGGAAGVG